MTAFLYAILITDRLIKKSVKFALANGSQIGLRFFPVHCWDLKL